MVVAMACLQIGSNAPRLRGSVGHLDTISSRRFCAIQGSVRPPDQSAEIMVVLLVYRNASRYRHGNCKSFNQAGLTANCLPNALDNGRRLHHIHFIWDHILLTAASNDDVSLTRHSLHAAGGIDQYFVTRSVAVSVIDNLEIVEIEDGEHETGAGVPRARTISASLVRRGSCGWQVRSNSPSQSRPEAGVACDLRT